MHNWNKQKFSKTINKSLSSHSNKLSGSWSKNWDLESLGRTLLKDHFGRTHLRDLYKGNSKNVWISWEFKKIKINSCNLKISNWKHNLKLLKKLVKKSLKIARHWCSNFTQCKVCSTVNQSRLSSSTHWLRWITMNCLKNHGVILNHWSLSSPHNWRQPIWIQVSQINKSHVATAAYKPRMILSTWRS